MTIRRRALIIAGALSCLTGLGGSARAETYPARPVTMIVPFAAGGPSDAIARLIGQSMSKTLGQQIIIENVTGAGGTIGAARVARADPDGYTLLIAHVSLPASASLYKTLQYDTATAFTPIGLVNYGPMVVAGRKDFPPADAAGLLATLKRNGTGTTIAHAGIGSNAHLCALLLQQALGTRFTDVAYRGTGPAMNDLMGGQVDVLCDQTTNAVPQIDAGSVKGYAVTSAERLDVLKSLPTLREAGLKDFEFVIWHGLYAPKGTPESVVTALNKALRVAVADPTIRSRFAAVGTEVFPDDQMTPQVHAERFQKEIATWREVIGKSGVAIGN